MQASIEDIQREIWLRRRNADEITWTTKNGQSMSIREMTMQHLENCLRICMRNSMRNGSKPGPDEGDDLSIY